MRLVTIAAAGGLCCALLAGCNGGKDKEGEASAAIEKPARKAGQWQQVTTLAGAPAQVMKICTDPSVEGTLPWWGRVSQDGVCKDISGKKNADGSYSFESRCDLGPAGKSGYTGTGTGDFQSKYEVKVRMNTAGAANPQLNGPHELTTSLTWVGACPADWKPGDVEVAGGMRMNYDPMQVAEELARAQAALKTQEAAEGPPAK